MSHAWGGSDGRSNVIPWNIHSGRVAGSEKQGTNAQMYAAIQRSDDLAMHALFQDLSRDGHKWRNEIDNDPSATEQSAKAMLICMGCCALIVLIWRLLA